MAFQQSYFRTVLVIGLFLLPAGLLLTACNKDSTTAPLNFALVPLPDHVNVRDLRFYVHDIYLVDEQGRKTAFQPQGESTVALVDLTAPEKNHSLTGTVSSGNKKFTGLEFKLGVPFALNHADPLSAQAPLNDGTLFWAWRQGYKFLRFDFSSNGSDYAFHLGSTGCESASAIRPPATPCGQPNVVTVTLRDMDPFQESIRVDPVWLISAMTGADVANCTGSYAAEPACALILTGLGLDLGTGQCADRCGQKLFR